MYPPLPAYSLMGQPVSSWCGVSVAGLLSKEACVQQLSLLRCVQDGSFCLFWQSKPDPCTCWHSPVGCALMLALLDMYLK